jgi:light-regulated signal transduction histidine kinase (bacteriophytochrome)
MFGSDEVARLEEYASSVAAAMERVRLVEKLASERERNADAVRRLNKELELRVAERTVSIQELEAFTYTVAHDLRAPLRAIDGFVGVLMEDHHEALPPDARECLTDVAVNARQMAQLIEDLLAFSRLGHQLPNRHRISPAALVKRALADLAPQLVGRDVRVKIGRLPACDADPVLLAQVYSNLLANAVKYTRKKDMAEITVGHLRDEEESVYYVKDNGVGFDAAYAGKLFGVFQRLHSDADYEGTGVGLAIVQRIVQRHGGRVWAESQPDKGAAFFFSVGKGQAA